jgi:hypothetical protein
VDSQHLWLLKKDWIVMLASTSCIMLTLSLMVLTIIAQSSQIVIWQRTTISGFIVLSSTFFMRAANQSLLALGSLIMAVSLEAETEAEEVQEYLDRKKDSAAEAAKAQRYFKIGMFALVLAVFLSFVFLAWPILSRLVCL